MALGLLTFGVASLVWLAMMVGLMILTGYGLYCMARHAGIPNPWLAFLPVANVYLTGLLAERSYYTYNGRVRKLAKWSLILNLLPVVEFIIIYGILMTSVVTGDEPVVALLFTIPFLLTLTALLVIYIYCYYYLFRDYAPENAVLFTIITVLFNIGFIFLLVEKDTVPVSVTGFGVYPYGRPKYDKWHRWNQMPPQAPGGYPPQGGGPGTTGPGDYYR